MPKVKIEYYESGSLKSVEMKGLFVGGKCKITSEKDEKPKVKLA